MLACPACGESNPERARFCLGCGQALEVTDDAEARRHVSMVFADLVGSTSIGDRYDAEVVRSITGRYFEAMRDVVERHEGIVEKFIGDAVVALFGVPKVREDDALRAVRAATEMRDVMLTLSAELETEFDVNVQVRIGVNTGQVVVGERRAGGSPAMGDAVNVAARLEQAASAGEVLIGESTYRLVREHVRVEPVEPLQLKGKAERVPAWRLLDIQTAPGVRATITEGNFDGRDPQLRELEAALSRSIVRRGCELVTVIGAAGIGKSRLATEFLAGRADATVLTGHCLAYGRGATYWPLREAVLAAAGLAGDEPVAVVEHRLGTLVGEANPDRASIVSHLLAIVTVNRDEAVPEDVPWATRHFFEALARIRPVVLVIDDLHWAEPGLFDVLEHLARLTHDAPLLLIALTRPEVREREAIWPPAATSHIEIALAALDEKTVANLIDHHELPDRVRQRVIATAEGNPLFLHQLVAMLVDEGHAIRDNGVVRWLPATPTGTDIAMPTTVAALLSARIDRLRREERAVIERAAVVGPLFYLEALEVLDAGPKAVLGEVLRDLSNKELVVTATSDIPGMTAYRFGHVLIRDAAYDGMTKSSRADLHEQLANWLESPAVAAVPDEIVGHHLAAAWEFRTQIARANDATRVLAQRAAQRLTAASRRLDLTDLTSAAALSRRAVGMLDATDPDWGRYALLLADQQLELGELDASGDLLHAIAADGDVRSAALAGVKLGRPHFLDETESAERKVDEIEAAIRVFEGWSDDTAQAHAYVALGDLYGMLGLGTQGLRVLKQAIRHAAAAGDLGLLARARSLLPIAYFFGATPCEEALIALDELVASADGDVRLRAEVEQMTCIMHAMGGRIDIARATAASARRLLAEVGHVLFLANFAQSSGRIEELAGDLDAAEREYARSITDLQALGDHDYLSTVAGMQARLLARRGKYEEAATVVRLARESGSADDFATQSLIRQAGALLHVADGDHQRARQAIAEAERLQEGSELLDYIGELQFVAAEVERAIGDTVSERRHLLAAGDAFTRKGNIVRAEEAARRLTELAARDPASASVGDPTDSRFVRDHAEQVEPNPTEEKP